MSNSEPKNIVTILGGLDENLEPLVYMINPYDDIINVDTSNGPLNMYLPDIAGGNLILYPKVFYINDTGNSCGLEGLQIAVFASANDTISGIPSIEYRTNGISAQIQICGQTEWASNDLEEKLNVEIQQVLGDPANFLYPFDNDRIFGGVDYVRTDDIDSVDFSTNEVKLGVTILIIHNDSLTPQFGDNFHKLSGSGDYVTDALNFIYCQVIDTTYNNEGYIVYSINQLA